MTHGEYKRKNGVPVLIPSLTYLLSTRSAERAEMLTENGYI